MLPPEKNQNIEKSKEATQQLSETWYIVHLVSFGCAFDVEAVLTIATEKSEK
jgi:hypothetical protein